MKHNRNQRQPLNPHRRPHLSINERGYVFLGPVRICRYVDGVITFYNKQRGGRGQRMSEGITPAELAEELVRLCEVDGGDGAG